MADKRCEGGHIDHEGSCPHCWAWNGEACRKEPPQPYIVPKGKPRGIHVARKKAAALEALAKEVGNG